MLQQFESTLRNRICIVFGLIHVGLVLGIFAAARLSVGRDFDWLLGMLFLGIFLLYAGSIVGAFFLVWPLLPWFRRVQETKTWGQEMLNDLPRLLELIQKTIEALKPAWRTLTGKAPESSSPSDTPPQTPPQ